MKTSVRWTCLLVVCCLATCQDTPSYDDLVKVMEDAAVSAMLKAAPLVADSCANAERDTINPSRPYPPRDCADVARFGGRKSGVYLVWPQGGFTHGIKVYCDLEKDGGGWTVIQRRGQFGNPKGFFLRRWRDYKFGFGDLDKEFWIGNDNLHLLSNLGAYVLRVDLEDDKNETRFATYGEFYVQDETNNYRLWVDLYKGDAGNSMKEHSGMFFSTVDRDNDPQSENCALEYKAGWWFGTDCHHANLNGLNLNGFHKSHADGINWEDWKGFSYSYPQVQLRIRPKSYP